MRRSGAGASPRGRRPHRTHLLVALGTWGAVAAARAPGLASPLGDAATQLACGERAQAAAALLLLAAAPHQGFGVPDESLTGTDGELASAAYDNLLDALAAARRRFPDLADQIDALLASWDFCALTAEEERWDLRLAEGQPWRRAPATISPLLGRGFAAWGLLPRRARGRPSWTAAALQDDSALVPQCQAQQPGSSPPHGPMPALPAAVRGVDASCEGPPPPVTAEAPVAPPPPAPARAQAVSAPPRPAARAVPEVPAKDVASPTTREGLSPLPGTVAASATASAAGNLGGAVGVSVAPWRNVFVRAGLGWRALTRWEETFGLEPTWSWGLGYDDWHVGTVSAQLNHWGPLRRLPDLGALEQAVANVGYKVALPAALGKVLSLRVDVSTPLTWAPSLGVGMGLKLPASCFVSLGVSKKLLDESALSWTYVLGRSQWKPGTLSLLVSNYGPNQVPALNLRNLALTVSWSWKL